jgi:upstream activation factor subunit UAF30
MAQKTTGTGKGKAQKSSSAASKGSTRKRSGGSGKQEETGVLDSVAEAVKAHPVATAAAAVAATGLAVAAGMALGGDEQPAQGRKRGGSKTAKKTGTAAKRSRSSGGATKSAKPRAGSEGARRGGLAQPVQPDSQLAPVVGNEPLTRAEMTKRLWDYIKKNGLQDSQNRRMINADDRLRPIFGQEQVSMFEMTRLVNKHVASSS